MSFEYLLAPFFAWLVAGSLKFLVNTVRARRLAFDLIGYGGMPSNHMTVAFTVVSLIGFKEGMDSPAFGAALGAAFLFLLDAISLRRQIGQHAERINRLRDSLESEPLRERLGHTRVEELAGVMLGAVLGFLIALV
jgi:acid phosphatase family membrane protein YuiD